jgi:flagellar biosynthetic protein FlhB
LAVGGLSFSTKALAFKSERINPLNNLGRIFNWRGLMELAKSFAKFSIVAVVAVWWLSTHAQEFISLGQESIEVGTAHAANLLGWSFLIVSLGTFFIAAVDVPFQLWQHQKQLRMSKQDIKEEAKDNDGKPEVKSRIRRMQRELAQRRMMQEIPKADVIVTNPTHFAVALKYDTQKMRAPKVVAKGADVVAAAIRQVASAHKVPFFEAPPLARAIFYSTEIDREIPKGLYVAVAQVLAYIYQLKEYTSQGGRQPLAPKNLPIPETLKK